jgi:AcrR family transcriptional regulator
VANPVRRRSEAETRPSRARAPRRLPAADRERQIVDEAIRFFAEVGFSGQTREFAERAGIAQPLLYRYFATKQDLIDRVFREVFLNRINPAWAKLIGDRSRPLKDRLADFYDAYSRATYTYEWVRIYMFSALMGHDINRRYIRIVENALLKPICAELRHHRNLPDPDVIPISELELEEVWLMHGGLFYYAVRKYIYQSRVSDDFADIVSRAVDILLDRTHPGHPRGIDGMAGAKGGPGS